MVTLVEWLALVLEADYIRRTVSLLFPPLSNSEIRKEEREQQGNYLPAWFIQLASENRSG